jgi:hypothetical protein
MRVYGVTSVNNSTETNLSGESDFRLEQLPPLRIRIRILKRRPRPIRSHILVVDHQNQSARIRTRYRPAKNPYPLRHHFTPRNRIM